VNEGVEAMQTDAELVWSVVEHSEAGDTLIGVYTSLDKARAVVSAMAQGRYEDYGIEGHVLDQGKETAMPWQVSLTRDGEHVATTPFVGCSCSDDELEYRKRSFIQDGGERMSVIVFAPTPGLAISAAERYRLWLLQNDLWTMQAQPLEPIEASV
jgi:hypothetical protein